MTCPTRASLQRRFDQVSARVDTAKQRLLERVATCSQAEFLALSDELDRACDLLRHLHAALDLHIRQHACLAHGDAATADGKQFNSGV